MKKYSVFALLMFILTYISPAYSQGVFPLFDSTWFGYNTGKYPQGQSPSAVKAADMDNDGDTDLVVAQENYSTGFVLLRNQGKGLFAPPVKFNSSHASKDIVVADFDNNGFKDVALTNTGTNFNGNTVAVYMNNAGAFAAAVNYTAGASPIGIVAADFDNDGDVDLAAANYKSASGTVSILVNKGNGTFNPAIHVAAGAKPYKLAVAHVNNDGLIDIIVGNEQQRMNILFNTGNNLFANRVQKSVLSEIWSADGMANVEADDVDNDGDNDIIYSSSQTWNGNNGQIALFRNKGNGTFAPFKLIDLTYYTTGTIDMEMADVNGDGWKDIVTTNYTGRTGDGYQLVLNDGTGNFLPAVLHPAGQSTYGLTLADINKDKKIDVITVDWYSMQVTVHRNFGKANFPVPPLFSTNNSVPGSLDAADIDGDGDLDIVSSASSITAVGVTVTVQKNNGKGVFTPGVAYSIRGGGVQAKFRDLNGDGKVDLLFATAISSPPYDFHTAINNGDGTFGARQTWSMNACGWNDIDAFDLDNDGDKDVVITEWLGCRNVDLSARRIFISKNNGKAGFSAPLIKVVNPFPGSIAGGDFNKDGKIDIVTGQSASIDLHLGTGTGDLQPPLTSAVAQSPYELIADDFNKDGNLDIAACTEYDYEGMSVLLGNGNGTFKPAQNYNGAYSPDLRNESGITSGDVDGDGDIDIIVGNAASNDVSIYLNKGNGTFNFRMRYGVYYSTASPIYADFSGDGKKDIAALATRPPSGLYGELALVKGRVLNVQAVTSKSIAAKEGDKVEVNKGITVLNNPFTNYINVKFANVPRGKVSMQLSDLAGNAIATTQFNASAQSLYQFNLSSKAITSGMYVLTVKTQKEEFTTLVLRQ